MFQLTQPPDWYENYRLTADIPFETRQQGKEISRAMSVSNKGAVVSHNEEFDLDDDLFLYLNSYGRVVFSCLKSWR